jgi:WD40 repeat protein
VAVSADGRTAVSGSRDKTVRAWDLRSGSCSAVLEGHADLVFAVAVSADGRTAVSGSYDKTVRAWDLRSGSCSAVHPDDSPEARVAWASVRGEGDCQASVGQGALTLQRDSEAILARFPGTFSRAASSPDGLHVIAGDGRGQMFFFRLCGPAV